MTGDWTREDWARVEEILGRALELPPPQRSVFLDEACADRPELRREVVSLLAESTAEPDFLDTLPPWLAEEGDGEASPPERIGPYRILGVLGRGGMGRVFLAEREARDFRQAVALKVIRRGLDTDDVIRRFRTERQILANLSHPNIAALHDVGATAEGLPYFVMEHVDGVPILRYCNEQALGVPERLRLFRTVCAAVDHAHRSLVVHRDIKPANILVTADGTPKLLDFGTAKILDPESDRPDGHTRVGTRLLTPAYAAPEQLRGAPITTACDIYALGVLLYELLTGAHPHRREGEAREETERRILEVDPVSPSVAVARTRPALRRALAGDLDTVVLQAMHREPEARYVSALALSEDLGRHLDGLPVDARRPTLAYRARKLVARRPLAVATTAAFVLLLGGSTAVTLHQNRRIREETARVSRERDKALQAQAFLLEMFGATGPDDPTGDTVTARELLDRRAASLESAYPDPETRAEMMTVLAEGYDKLGVLDRAEPLARGALELRRGLDDPAEADVSVSLDILGWILHERGDEAGAESALRESVALGRKAFPAEGDPRLARALNDLGVVREAAGDYGEAAGLYRESLAMRRRFLGETHVGVPTTMSNLSVVLYRMGDLDGAIDMSREALERFRAILGPDHQRSLIVQSNLAAMESSRGDHAAAAAEHRELLDRRRRLFGPRHPTVAHSMTLLGNELVQLGRTEEADSLLEAALALQTELYGERHELVATTLRVLGDLAMRTHHPAEALARFRRADAALRALHGPMHRDIAMLRARIASAEDTLGDADAALSDYREAVRVSTGTTGALSPRTLTFRLSLIELLARRGMRADAEANLDDLEAAVGERADDLPAAVRTKLEETRALLSATPPG